MVQYEVYLSQLQSVTVCDNDGCLSDGTDVLYNKFNVDGSSPPDNPPQHQNTDYNCVVATTAHWKVSRCDERHHVVCQSDHYIPPGMTT